MMIINVINNNNPYRTSFDEYQLERQFDCIVSHIVLYIWMHATLSRRHHKHCSLSFQCIFAISMEFVCV